MASVGSNKRLYLAALVACLTAALFGYSVGFIGGVLVLPSFLHHFHLDDRLGMACWGAAGCPARYAGLFEVGEAPLS
jgi:hypothetical protein